MTSTFMIQISRNEPTFFDEKRRTRRRTRLVRRIFRIKDILVGSPYRVNITLKNVGIQVFGGGLLIVSAQWATNQSTISSYPIKSLASNESQTVVFQHQALDKYFGLLFAKLEDNNRQPVQLYNEENVLYMLNQCFGSVWAIDEGELLGRYALTISAISLVVLMAKDVIIPLVIWYAIFSNNTWLLDALKWFKLLS